MKDREYYAVDILVAEHPNNFRGPKFWKNFRSMFSARQNGGIGSSYMTLEEATELAKKQTDLDGYIPQNGKLMISKGVIRRTG